MPPPGLAPDPARRNHVDGPNTTTASAALISRYVALAKASPAMADVPASRIGRMVRRFLATGQREDEAFIRYISYADPTGEAAARNVDRARRAA